MRSTLILCLGTFFVSCAPSRQPPKVEASPIGVSIVERPALARYLRDAGVGGVVAWLNGDRDTIECSDVRLCKERFTPASTFKIPNSIIGLETGVIADADFVIPWDGVTREIVAWNRDHTLRSAIQVSCVPYYQELARRVGIERMRAWVTTLGYGNSDIGDVVDRFWLDGPLAISPAEQVVFLRQLDRGSLPITSRTCDIMRDILVLARTDDATLRGKTGWDGKQGWFVGWAERGGRTAYVAVLLTDPPMSDALIPLRRAIAETLLRDASLLPSAME